MNIHMNIMITLDILQLNLAKNKLVEKVSSFLLDGDSQPPVIIFIKSKLCLSLCNQKVFSGEWWGPNAFCYPPRLHLIYRKRTSVKKLSTPFLWVISFKETIQSVSYSIWQALFMFSWDINYLLHGTPYQIKKQTNKKNLLLCLSFGQAVPRRKRSMIGTK